MGVLDCAACNRTSRMICCSAAELARRSSCDSEQAGQHCRVATCQADQADMGDRHGPAAAGQRGGEIGMTELDATPQMSLECGAENAGAARVCARCGAPVAHQPPAAAGTAGEVHGSIPLPHELSGRRNRPGTRPNALVILKLAAISASRRGIGSERTEGPTTGLPARLSITRIQPPKAWRRGDVQWLLSVWRAGPLNDRCRAREGASADVLLARFPVPRQRRLNRGIRIDSGRAADAATGSARVVDGSNSAGYDHYSGYDTKEQVRNYVITPLGN
jgi:hypothetical protein